MGVTGSQRNPGESIGNYMTRVAGGRFSNYWEPQQYVNNDGTGAYWIPESYSDGTPTPGRWSDAGNLPQTAGYNDSGVWEVARNARPYGGDPRYGDSRANDAFSYYNEDAPEESTGISKRAGEYKYLMDFDKKFGQKTNEEAYAELLAEQANEMSGLLPGATDFTSVLKSHNPYNPNTQYKKSYFDAYRPSGTGWEDEGSFVKNVPGLADSAKASFNTRRSASRKEHNKFALSALASVLSLGAFAPAAAGAGAATGAGGGGLFVGSSGLLGNTGSALLNSMANGAVQGGLSSAISGGNIGKGLLTGGVGGGIGNLTSGISTGYGALADTVVRGGIGGAAGALLNKGDVGRGLFTGALTAGVNNVAPGSGQLVRPAIGMLSGGQKSQQQPRMSSQQQPRMSSQQARTQRLPGETIQQYLARR